MRRSERLLRCRPTIPRTIVAVRGSTGKAGASSGAFVREEILTWENQTKMHEVRAEFFERPHYPASTTVGVIDPFSEDALVEIELEAEIPDDGWETEVLTDDE